MPPPGGGAVAAPLGSASTGSQHAGRGSMTRGGGGKWWGQVTANTPTDPPGTLDVAPPSRSPTRSRLSLWPQKQMERGSVVNGCGRPSP